MRVVRLEITALSPFRQMSFPFSDEQGPRMVTVVHGGGGVGKTALLNAIATTRPGNAIVQQPQRTLERPSQLEPAEEQTPPRVMCEWSLGQDDPERPHTLSLASPNARVFVSDEQEGLRRREQAMFDKLARERGFAFLAIPSARWFSRQPIAIIAPTRNVARYDVRASLSFDDRSDLARDTKQALAYAAIASSLQPRGPERGLDFRLHGDAMRSVIESLVELAGFSYAGLDPFSFEPIFRSASGAVRPFDGLPTRARHLVAFGALTVKTLWAAYPGRDPRLSEGVVAIDEVDLHQDPGIQGELVNTLRNALPNVQWILTTTSPVVAGSCDIREVLALRWLPDIDHVELYLGTEARTH
jgi:hypothetical protein